MGEITVNMDFPMTADVAASSQSGGAMDFTSSSQSTDKSGFSQVFKGEKSANENESVSTTRNRSETSDSSASANSKTEKTEQAGNDLPEEGNGVPNEEASVQLSKEEQKLLESLAEQGDPLATALLQAQTEEGQISLSALEALKKGLASTDTESASAKTLNLLQARAESSQATLSKPSLAASPTSTTTDARAQPLNTNDPDAAINTTAESDADTDLQQMLEKRLAEMGGKSSTVTQNSNGSTNITELPRALANQPTTTTPTVPQNAVSLRQPGWEQALTNSVQWMNKENLQEANIRVRPAELGPIQVKVSMNNDQLSLHFNAAHAATREALESAMPRLREALAASGMDLGNVDVSDQGLAKQFQQQDYSENGESTQALWQDEDSLNPEDDQTQILTTPLPSTSTSAVDIFA